MTEKEHFKVKDIIKMTEKRFPTVLNHFIIVNTGKKPSKEEIKHQLMNQEPLITDEEAFERHLVRKWINDL